MELTRCKGNLDINRRESKVALLEHAQRRRIARARRRKQLERPAERVGRTKVVSSRNDSIQSRRLGIGIWRSQQLTLLSTCRPP